MRKVHFSTPEQVAKYLALTLDVIDKGNVPEDLREVAFTAVFGQITGAQVFIDPQEANGPVERALAIPEGKSH